MEWLRVVTLWAKTHGCDRYVRKLIRGWALYDMAMYCATQRNHRYMKCPRCQWVWRPRRLAARQKSFFNGTTDVDETGTMTQWNNHMRTIYAWLHDH
jgi:hypothetical protein